jgi:molybdopterin molybdotransferase
MTAPSPPRLTELTRALPGFNPAAVTIEQARALLAAMVVPIAETEACAIGEALDRILAGDLISPINVPAHDNAAMDGFSVQAADLDPKGETRLAIVAESLAGRPCPIAPGPGQAVRIMTGAMMPAGHDTVVPRELCRVEGRSLGIPPGQLVRSNCRMRGEDLRAGQTALGIGTRIGPAELGLIASLGLSEVIVRRRARVAFFSSGDELRGAGQTIAAGQIYDSNRYTLLGMIRRLGAEPIDLGIVADQPPAIEQVINHAARSADLVISSAGVSKGDADFTQEALSRLGEVAAWQLLVRPGRPLAVGRVGKAIYIGLPGNPVAAMLGFIFLARDVLLALAGAAPRPLAIVPARLAEPIRKRPGRLEWQRGRLLGGAEADTGELRVATTGDQGSGILRSMTEADCIIVLESDRGDCAAGEWVSCVPMAALLNP